GNLAGHLIVLRQACAEMVRVRTTPKLRLAGVRDTLDLALEALAAVNEQLQKPILAANRMKSMLADFSSALDDAEKNLPALDLALLQRSADGAIAGARKLADEAKTGKSYDLLDWMDGLCTCIASHKRDLELLSSRGRWPANDRDSDAAVANEHREPAYAVAAG